MDAYVHVQILFNLFRIYNNEMHYTDWQCKLFTYNTSKLRDSTLVSSHDRVQIRCFTTYFKVNCSSRHSTYIYNPCPLKKKKSAQKRKIVIQVALNSLKYGMWNNKNVVRLFSLTTHIKVRCIFEVNNLKRITFFFFFTLYNLVSRPQLSSKQLNEIWMDSCGAGGLYMP